MFILDYTKIHTYTHTQTVRRKEGERDTAENKALPTATTMQ